MRLKDYMIEGKKINDFKINYMVENPLKDGGKIINSAIKYIKDNFNVKGDKISSDSEGLSYTTLSWKKDKFFKLSKEGFCILKWDKSTYSKKGKDEWLIKLNLSGAGILHDFNYEIEDKKNLFKTLKDAGVPLKNQ